MKVAIHIQESIRVAAKAGFLSKRIWMEYFARGNRRWKNRQWKSLIDLGYFARVPDYGFVESALNLSDKGKAIAGALGFDAVFSPPAKNLWHDEELVRLALFLERKGWISGWMTDQELRVNGKSESFFRNEMRPPKIPDLIIEWNRPHDKIFWAVELERTRKEFTRYYDMVGAYRGISRIDSVLVIAASKSIEANIKRAQGKLNYPQGQRPMLFATLSQVSEDPGSCEIRMNLSHTTLGKMAQALVGEKSFGTNEEGKTVGPDQSPSGASQIRAA